MPALPRKQLAPRLTGNAPPAPCTRSARAAASSHADAERAQRVEHHAACRRIRAVPSSGVSPSRERREQQRAVGDALRAGQRDDARGARAARARCEVKRRQRLAARATVVAAPRVPRAPRRRAPRRTARCERRAVARARSAARDAVERVADSASISPSSASRLASAMSRHISGELAGDAREVAKAARRVSRSSAAASGARGELGDEREGEQVRQVRHRGEDRVVVARRRACDARAARLPQRARRVATASAVGLRRAASGSTLRSANSVGERRGGAACARCRRSDAPGRTRGSVAPRRVARGGDHVLLGAAGVGDDACAGRGAARSRRTAPGTARPASRRSTTSASRSLARPVGVERRRAVDRRRARARASRFARRAADADDLARRRRRACSASANEPPISPTPTTTSLLDARRHARAQRAERLRERGEEALVLRAAGRR